MRRLRTAAVLGSVLAALSLAMSAVPAQATGGDRLPLGGFGDIAVDGTRDHVFVSGGPSSNEVVVTDFHGRVIKTIREQYGATGLLLSADGRTLYVALAAGDAVSAIDARTLTERARYATGSGTCPAHLARTDRRVWFGYGCAGEWTGGIGSLDVAATPPAVTLDQHGAVNYHGQPLLTVPAAAPTTLVAGQLGLSPSGVYVYTETAEAKLELARSSRGVGNSLADLTVTPGGDTLFSAAGAPHQVQAFALGDLSRRGVLPTGPYPDAVVTAPDGRHVAAGVAASGTDVFVYRIDGLREVETFDLGSGGGKTLLPRGLVWSPDGKKLFAVTGDRADEPPTLRVLSKPTGHD